MAGQETKVPVLCSIAEGQPEQLPRPAFGESLDQAASASPFHSWAGRSISLPPRASNSVARS